MSFCNKLSRGFTLTETAIMLGVAGFVLAGVWSAGSSVWQSHQIDKALQQVVTVAQNMRDYYGPLGGVLNAAGAPACPIAAIPMVEITSVLDDAARRIFPVDMLESPDANDRPINHAAATATIGSFHVYCVNDSQAFRLELTTLKQDVCAKILLSLPLLDPGMRIPWLQVNGTATAIDIRSIANPGSVAVPLPLTVTRAQALCDVANNTIRIDFQL